MADTTQFTARGLVLTSVQGMVHARREAVNLHSTIGHGSTLTILSPTMLMTLVEPQAKLNPERMQGTGLVLIVDDEAIALLTTQAILKRNGYQVLTAANGEIAVRMVRQHKDELALVILDLTMPVMGGEEAFALIRESAPALPVILTSGYDAAEAVGKFGYDALAGFIQKPSTVADLLETIKTVLNK